MTKHEKLRKLLAKGLKLEENYIISFAPFILTTLNDSDLPSSDIKRIRQMVQVIEHESHRHKTQVEAILRGLELES